MATREVPKQSSATDFEKARSYFVDSRDPDIARLALLGNDAIMAMAQIYLHQGNIAKMDSRTQKWLTESSLETNGTDHIGDIKIVLGQVLSQEASTRRFDHRFMGQIHPQGNEIGILSSLIAAYMNTNTVVAEVSGAENQMESEALAWFADIFGYDRREFSGNIVSGGTSANMAALWVAREKKISDLKKTGHYHRGGNLYVIGTDMAHYSVTKVCDQLGENVIFLKAPVDSEYHTDILALDRMVSQVRAHNGQIMAIVGLAGETETGQVDNLNGLADVAEKNNIFLHVDAAYGGPFVLSRKGNLFYGINRADSITVDPHKLLYTPYPAGVILFKDKRNHMLIEKGMRQHARYLLSNDIRFSEASDADEAQVRNFGLSRPEGSMGSAGVIATWATQRLLGRRGIAALLNHDLDLTEHAYARINTSEFLHPLHCPDTNSILVAMNDIGLSCNAHSQLMRTAQKRLDQQGWYISLNEDVDCDCGDKRPAFRFVAMHPHTSNEDVDELFARLEKEIAVQLEDR